MKGIFLYPKTKDASIKDGTVEVGEIDAQVAELVLMAVRGGNKEYPLIGGEIMKKKNGPADPIWCAEVKRMLLACGLAVKRVEFDGDELTIR